MAEELTSNHSANRVERVLARHLQAKTSVFLTLEYVVSIGAVIASLVCLDAAIKAAFTLWNNGTVALGMPFSWMLPVSGGYVGAIWAGFASVIFALIGMFFHRRTAASMVSRPAYTDRQAYKIVTYATLAILSVLLLTTLLTMFTIIITSLLLIGSESSISSLYLNVFLPTLLTVLIVGFATFIMYRYTLGRGDLSALYSVLLALGTVALLVLILTVAIRSHDAYSANDYGRTSSSLTTDPQSGQYRY